MKVRPQFIVALSMSLILAACLSRQTVRPSDPLSSLRELRASFDECKNRYVLAAFSVKKTAPLCAENIACHIGKVGEWRAAIGQFRKCATIGDMAIEELASACAAANDEATIAECGREIERIDGSEPGDIARAMAESHSQTLDNIEAIITGSGSRGL